MINSVFNVLLLYTTMDAPRQRRGANECSGYRWSGGRRRAFSVGAKAAYALGSARQDIRVGGDADDGGQRDVDGRRRILILEGGDAALCVVSTARSAVSVSAWACDSGAAIATPTWSITRTGVST
jgi:hypothetical protein